MADPVLQPGFRERWVGQVPFELIEGLERYAEQRLRTGDFLCACLAGDFHGAVARCHRFTLPHLPALSALILSELPAEAQGSYERVDAWCARRPGEETP